MEQIKSIRFGTTWRWVNYDTIFWWTIPLKTGKWAVPVSGPHAAGFGNAHPAEPNEGGLRGHGGPAWAPPAAVWAPAARPAPHSAASVVYGKPGGPAPGPERYVWAAQPEKSGGTAAVTWHGHISTLPQQRINNKMCYTATWSFQPVYIAGFVALECFW